MADNARFYMVGPEQPLTTPSADGKPLATKSWYTLYWQLYNAAVNGIPQPPTAVPVGVSPLVYTASIKGQLNIQGGTVVSVDFSRDGGTTTYPFPPPPCVIPLCKGDQIRVTFAMPPAVTFFPM